MQHVVVVGASFAGLSFANALVNNLTSMCHQSGQLLEQTKLTLVEIKSETEHCDPRGAGCVRFHDGAALLEELGLPTTAWEKLQRSTHIMTQNMNSGRLPIGRNIVSRSILLEELRTHLHDCANILYSSQLSGVSFDTVENRIYLNIKTQHRDHQQIPCDFLVVADGLISSTRASLIAWSKQHDHLPAVIKLIESRTLLVGDACRHFRSEIMFGLFRYTRGVSTAIRNALDAAHFVVLLHLFPQKQAISQKSNTMNVLSIRQWQRAQALRRSMLFILVTSVIAMILLRK